MHTAKSTNYKSVNAPKVSSSSEKNALPAHIYEDIEDRISYFREAVAEGEESYKTSNKAHDRHDHLTRQMLLDVDQGLLNFFSTLQTDKTIMPDFLKKAHAYYGHDCILSLLGELKIIYEGLHFRPPVPRKKMKSVIDKVQEIVSRLARYSAPGAKFSEALNTAFSPILSEIFSYKLSEHDEDRLSGKNILHQVSFNTALCRMRKALAVMKASSIHTRDSGLVERALSQLEKDSREDNLAPPIEWSFAQVRIAYSENMPDPLFHCTMVMLAKALKNPEIINRNYPKRNEISAQAPKTYLIRRYHGLLKKIYGRGVGKMTADILCLLHSDLFDGLSYESVNSVIKTTKK